MAESLVQVTEGTGKKLHTNQRTIGANAVEDEYVLPGEYALASYVATTPVTFVACTTASDHLMQLMAGASLNVRVRRIRVEQAGLITAAAITSFGLYRLTTAGTGGTAVTPAKLDTADAAAGAAGMTLPTVKGTESTLIDVLTMFPVQTAPAGGVARIVDEWVAGPSSKPILIPAGAANGIVVKNLYARPGLTVSVTIEFTETSFV